MTYTSFSIGTPGRAWDGIEFGSDAWQMLFAKQTAILEAAGAETAMSGFAAAIGKWVNVNTYPSVEAGTKVIAQLASSQLFDVEHSGPFVAAEDMFGLMMN